MGEDAALTLVRELGKQVSRVRSPTSWICSAVAKMIKEAAAAELGPAGDASGWDEEEEKVAEGSGKKGKGKGAKGKAANGKTSRGKSNGPPLAEGKGKKRK